ncbi:MAG: MarR family transcriptional regulator [Bacteroidetes bacterium 4484_276]|nr:MAG: MarR family transcriptional regulator [Bacteroidetes bacterium 4484_276]OYT11765.1 MAG: MarR family transcriptional regulator [Bacteroidetes bacterium 4572_114]
MDAQQIVLKTLKDSEAPLKGGEIVEKSGLNKKDVDKAIKQLKVEEKIFSPKRCFYDAK